MRHARDDDLDRIESLLIEVRQRGGLVEKKRGIFYRRGKSWLHFHEHQGALLADLRSAESFVRYNVVDAEGAATLLVALDASLTG